MRIDGAWSLFDETILRPVIRAEARKADGSWLPITFLVDTGADRTVLSAGVLAALEIPSAPTNELLEGVGGQVQSVVITTQVRLIGGSSVLLEGKMTAFTDPEALDMSVLGRDITNYFALIVDRPQDIVCMLGQKHRYAIFED